MRILDRERYWAFIKAYFICYFSLVGLYIVIDAFSNFDEFTKRADGLDLVWVMGRYYLIRQSQMFDQLSGVIGMMAAIFTVTWMQKNNEHLAMLAAGVSTHRAIRPVLISSLFVSLIVIANQELIMPPLGPELSKSHDDDGEQKVHVSSRYDSERVLLHANEADRATRTLIVFHATIPVEIYGSMREIKADQATYVPPDDPRAPLKGGWLVRGATISPPLDSEAFAINGEFLRPVLNPEAYPRPYVAPVKTTLGPGEIAAPAPVNPTPHSEIPYLAAVLDLPLAPNPLMLAPLAEIDKLADVGKGTYFLRSSLNFQAMTRKPTWYSLASTYDLFQGLTDPSTEGSERIDVAMFVHVRILRPVMGLTLLFMSLPLVLSGYGRNSFLSLGFALGNSGMFYGANILCSFLGSAGWLSPPMVAWLPFIGFGTLASVRWARIRT